ncbi:Conserved hypothetical protein [gamma proteobacterium HdN1]|nr:Conserved hypothetical protein [gamma proteobacterium HdN1]
MYALPPALRQIKESILGILVNHINTFFGTCDDLFFELAKKAASNKEQNLYFDTMREIRMRKPDVISQFKREYESLYRDISKPKSIVDEPKNPFESLNLVANDEMEQNVAVSGIVGKVRATWQEELYALNCRFDYLLHSAKINESNNPLDPAQLCTAFSRSLKVLDVDFTARIILLKQFDRVVVREFGQMYHLANELLIASGVLPKIRSSIINNSQGGNTPHRQRQHPPNTDLNERIGGANDMSNANNMSMETSSNTGPQKTYEVVANLMHAVRSIGQLPRDIRNRYANQPRGPALPAGDLQHYLNQQLDQASDDALALDLRELVYNGLVALGSPSAPRSLEEADEDIINLVAMFFDYVLDDNNMPVPIQALVARLQIPVLKVTLADRSFFSSQNHPVRRFINEIAKVSIGWDESDKTTQDSLFGTIERLVHRILAGFRGDIGLFEECYQALLEFTNAEQKRSQLIEKRTSEAAVGKAKVDQAREQVQQILFTRIEKAVLPAPIWDLLVTDWQRLLIHNLLKYGTECIEWVEAVQFIDDLCWYCNRHDDGKSQARKARLLPLLLDRANQGYQQLQLPKESASTKLTSLNALLEQLLQGNQQVGEQGISAQHLAELGQSDAGGKSWKEMTALERQQAQQQVVAFEYLQKVERLKVGSWVAYTPRDGGRVSRCKLAARIDANEHLVFVNRFGFKAMERSKQQFAHDIQLGEAHLLESGLLFDRAMDNIANSLKKLAPPKLQVS